jgi:ribosomal protein L2
MPLKKFRPMTPALRHTQLPDFAELSRGKPLKP